MCDWSRRRGQRQRPEALQAEVIGKTHLSRFGPIPPKAKTKQVATRYLTPRHFPQVPHPPLSSTTSFSERPEKDAKEPLAQAPRGAGPEPLTLIAHTPLKRSLYRHPAPVPPCPPYPPSTDAIRPHLTPAPHPTDTGRPPPRCAGTNGVASWPLHSRRDGIKALTLATGDCYLFGGRRKSLKKQEG